MEISGHFLNLINICKRYLQSNSFILTKYNRPMPTFGITTFGFRMLC
jgi:hypothetical protein